MFKSVSLATPSSAALDDTNEMTQYNLVLVQVDRNCYDFVRCVLYILY